MNNETREFLEQLIDALKVQSMSAKLTAQSLTLLARDEHLEQELKARIEAAAANVERLDNSETVQMLEEYLNGATMDAPPKNDARYITRKEYAQKNNITVRTVDRQIRSGKIKTRRLFGRVLIDTKNSPHT